MSHKQNIIFGYSKSQCSLLVPTPEVPLRHMLTGTLNDALIPLIPIDPIRDRLFSVSACCLIFVLIENKTKVEQNELAT